MATPTSPQRLPFSQLLIYAAGQGGWVLTSFAIFNLLIYFYLPPEDGGERLFPPFIYAGSILGIGTLVGILGAGGRLFDAVTDPLIARWSDRYRSRLGRRRGAMLLGVFPTALFAVLSFVPPGNDPTVNGWWLTGCLLLFYFSFTVFFVPYSALVAELGHDPRDRAKISTAMALSWAVGFMIGQGVYFFKDLLVPGFGQTVAFQLVVAGFSVVGLLAMLLPIVFLEEGRYAQRVEGEDSATIRQAWAYRPLRNLLLAELCYWIATTFVSIGIAYYTVELFRLDEEVASLFMLLAFICSFLCYPLVLWAVRRFGKVRTSIFGYGWFIAVLIAVGLAPRNEAVFYALGVASGLTIAIFSLLPLILLSDFANAYQTRERTTAAGIFFAARSLAMKAGMSLAALLFPSLLLLNAYGEALGTKVTTLAAAGISLLGLYYMAAVDEPAA